MARESHNSRQSRLRGEIDRALLAVVHDRMRDEPVIMLEGARAVGKSTLLAQIAAAHDVPVIDLDNDDVMRAAADDPAFTVRGQAPVCIDEYQRVPEVLQAIKAELNRDSRPGRFILTGSSSRDALPPGTQTLTGRLHVLPVRPLSQAELYAKPGLLRAALDGTAEYRIRTQSGTTREDYIAAVIAGGFPLSLSRGPSARDRWLDDHIATSLRRDTLDLANIRRAASLPPLFRQLAAQSAQLLNIAKAADRLDLDVRTAGNYVHLLEQLFLIQRLPAWGRTLRSRVGASPKIHLLDSGVAARALRLSSGRLDSRDPAALSEFGHLLETFVYGEVAAQASWLDGVTLGHYRTRDGDEVDLVVERGDGRVIAIEVKASGAVHHADLAGLRALRDLLGDRFIAGLALYLGPQTYAAGTSGERIFVLPVDRLWAE